LCHANKRLVTEQTINNQGICLKHAIYIPNYPFDVLIFGTS
jgi:hypothetical protein